MSFNFNGVNKNKVYMNGVEVTKAYMNGVEFYSSSAVYKLNFDSANQDHLQINSGVNIQNNGDFISIKIDKQVSTTQNERLTGSIANNTPYLIILNTTGQILVNGAAISLNLFLSNGVNILKISKVNNKIEFELNGTAQNTTLTSFYLDYLFKNSTSFCDAELLEIEINSESFPLSEGSGNTITGDNNTVGTINTSNAAGIDYINSNIWEEIVPQYELNFDSSNQDYTDFNTNVNWVNLSDAYFKFEFEYSQLISTSNRCVFSVGSFDDSTTGLIRILITPNVANFLAVYISGKNKTNQIASTYSLDGTQKYTIELNNLQLTVNGVLIDTYTDQVVDIDSTSFKPTISKASYVNNFYSDFTYNTIELNGESFPLSEGSGNTTTGSSGTVGTINTSNAAGIDYINANVWEEIV